MATKKQPCAEDREAVLISQRGCCLYCMQPLDETIYHHGKPVALELEWDHVVPFAYLQDNPSGNWAAACQVCNGIKSDLMFPTLDSARQHIQARRERLGYTFHKPWWHDVEPEPTPISRSERTRPCKGCGSAVKYQFHVTCCDNCRCVSLNSRGKRCRNVGLDGGKCEFHRQHGTSGRWAA